MKRVYSIAAVAAVGLVGICPFCRPEAAAGVPAGAVAGHAAGADESLEKAELTRVTLQIEGMTCGGCAIAARKVLRDLDGVQEAKVDYAKKTAVVSYDPARLTPVQMIEALKTKLGYTARVQDEHTL